LTSRYEQALQALGEREEQVSELKEDVVEIKAEYRKLVDTLK